MRTIKSLSEAFSLCNLKSQFMLVCSVVKPHGRRVIPATMGLFGVGNLLLVNKIKRFTRKRTI